MVALMRQGGDSAYDLVSASGDASLRLIKGGDVAPIDVNLIPSWKNFIPQLQSPPHNTVNGVHYGISLQWGPNLLMYNPKVIKTPPSSWSIIYSPKYKGQITVPDNPIQIADAALYLSRHDPSLSITDPYELTEKQLDAAVALLKKQRPLIVKYWALASDEIDLFKNGNAIVGAAWPYQVSTLKADHAPVAEEIPSEGATGWADTWMMASHAKHPNCALMWMRYISTPKVQAEQAVSYGETPANRLACPYMNQLQKGACAVYHANAPTAYFNSIKFWKTPTTTCDNGQTNCTDYSEWDQKWTEVKG
jgi:putative spermidine/putrescine transport system substrate-binding protein